MCSYLATVMIIAPISQQQPLEVDLASASSQQQSLATGQSNTTTTPNNQQGAQALALEQPLTSPVSQQQLQPGNNINLMHYSL